MRAPIKFCCVLIGNDEESFSKSEDNTDLTSKFFGTDFSENHDVPLSKNENYEVPLSKNEFYNVPLPKSEKLDAPLSSNKNFVAPLPMNKTDSLIRGWASAQTVHSLWHEGTRDITAKGEKVQLDNW